MKSKLYFFVLLAVIFFGFMSCDRDEVSKVTSPTRSEIVGKTMRGVSTYFEFTAKESTWSVKLPELANMKFDTSAKGSISYTKIGETTARMTWTVYVLDIANEQHEMKGDVTLTFTSPYGGTVDGLEKSYGGTFSQTGTFELY